MFKGSHGMQSRNILTSLQCQIQAPTPPKVEMQQWECFLKLWMQLLWIWNDILWTLQSGKCWENYRLGNLNLYIFLGCMFLPVSAVHFLMYCMHNSLSLPWQNYTTCSISGKVCSNGCTYLYREISSVKIVFHRKLTWYMD